MGGLVAVHADVLQAALRSRRGAGNALLRAIGRGKVRMVATTALFHHYEAALAGEKRAHAFLPLLARVCVPVAVHYRWHPYFGDMASELLFEAAVNGGAKAIVANWGFEDTAPRFGLKAMTPQQCLREYAR